ncbi:hypothetical protein TNCV_3615721, partial [Trichonephila clavipes]
MEHLNSAIVGRSQTDDMIDSENDHPFVCFVMTNTPYICRCKSFQDKYSEDVNGSHDVETMSANNTNGCILQSSSPVILIPVIVIVISAEIAPSL